MAKLTAPLLSLGASGTIADTLTIGSWRGVPYARQRVIPSNPKTAAQTQTRGTFAWLNAVWKAMPALALAPWSAGARGKPLTDRNLFIKSNLPGLRGATDLTNFVGSPGVLSAPPPAAVNITPGVGQITIDLTEPTLPQGWTTAEAVAIVIPDQAPDGAFTGDVQAASDGTSPYSIQFTGLSAGAYFAAGWFRFLRPDGQSAYSVSLGAVTTVT